MTRPRAFTLTELLIAITVLVAVLLAVSKIFTTTGDVVSLGEANADLLQETNAIDRQLRDDLSRATPEGVFAIRCVRVPNDINLNSTGSLLEPTLPPTAYLRADQIVFFANGVESSKTFREGHGSNQKGQGVVSRVYFGHAYQLSDQSRPVEVQGNVPYGFDLNPSGSPLFPWSVEQRQVLRTNYDNSDNAYQFSNVPQPVKMPSIDARSWLLARQAVILVDDDADSGAPDTRYMFGQVATAQSIFLNDQVIGAPVLPLVHGRVDGAATQLNDVRQQILFDANNNPRAWNVPGTGDDQRRRIMDFFGGLVYYPRAERIAPSMHRVDQALTNSVIGTGCSSVRIEWTYHNGVGKVVDRFGSVLWGGVATRGQDTANVTLERQPWFGVPDPYPSGDSYATRVNQGLVVSYEEHEAESLGAQTIDFTNIEEFKTIGRLEFYEAVFGFNQDMPLDIDPTSATYGQPTTALGFTPMPSAIRVTLTLHDSNATIEAGREVQFIIDLPRRSEANVF